MTDYPLTRPDGTMDCGDNSCAFAIERGGMRTNGGCQCLDELDRRHVRLRAALRVHAAATRAEIQRLRARVAELEQGH